MAAARHRELCIMACAFCRDTQFWRYLQDIDPQRAAWSEGSAKEFVLVVCGIGSRTELDSNAGAAQRFHQLVRIPFITWRANSANESTAVEAPYHRRA